MKCVKCKKETKNVFYPKNKEARYAKCNDCLSKSMSFKIKDTIMEALSQYAQTLDTEFGVDDELIMKDIEKAEEYIGAIKVDEPKN